MTAVLGGVIVFVILAGWPTEMYGRIKDAATALGAVIAASALAWSYFYQAVAQHDESTNFDEIVRNIDELSEKR